MSPALQKKEWLKQYYEMLILVVVLILLLLSAIWLVISVNDRKSEIKAASWERNDNPAPALPVGESLFEETLTSLENPFQTGTHSNRMFVSELRVSAIGSGKPIPYRALKCTFTLAEQPPIVNITELDSDFDGLPDVFESRHDFNPFDPDDADFDPDADGFTNKEEFNWNTNPTNALEAPPLTAKLRYSRIAAVPFKLRFLSVIQGVEGERYQLNLRSLSRTYFVELGETIVDRKNQIAGIKVLRFNPDAPAGPTLILEKDGREISLVQNKAINEDEWVARLVFLIDGRTFAVRTGSEFELKEQKYKVIDINRKNVVLRNINSGENLEVSPLSISEEEDLRDLKMPSGMESAMP